MGYHEKVEDDRSHSRNAPGIVKIALWDVEEMQEAISTYAARAAEKLREQDSNEL